MTFKEKKMTHRSKRFNIKIILIACVFGLLYWFFESLMHVITLSNSTFVEGLFPSESHELWMRYFVALVVISVAIYVQLIISRLRESRERFRALTESTSDWIWELGIDGIFTYSSPKVMDLLGYEPREVVGKTPFDLMPEKEAKRIKEFFRDNTESREPFSNLENICVHKDGRQVNIETSGVPIFDESGTLKGYRGINRDVTKRKAAEAALQESEARYRGLFDSMSSGVAVYEATEDGSDFVFREFNQKAEQIDQISKEDVLGKKVTDTFPGVKEFGLFDVFQRVWKTGEAEHYPVTLYKDQRHSKWFDNYVYKLPSGEIVAVHDNVTERKQAEKKLIDYQQQLKSLASQLSLAEERQRRQIAIDLHDNIAQNLILFKLKVGTLKESSATSEIVEPLEEIYTQIDSIVHNVRTLIFDLSSPALYELGFEAAIREWLNDQIQEKHGLDTEFEDDGKLKPLGDDVQALLYQAVRELSINIVKHAKATRMKVSICRKDSSISISVVDDGIGFESPADGFGPSRSGGFGLFNIKERLEYLGGGLSVSSSPGQGTNVTLTVPIKCEKSSSGAEMGNP